MSKTKKEHIFFFFFDIIYFNRFYLIYRENMDLKTLTFVLHITIFY